MNFRYYDENLKEIMKSIRFDARNEIYHRYF